MRHRVDEVGRILDIEATGLSPQAVIDYALTLLAERPEFWGWDWIISVTEISDDISLDQVGKLADHYAGLPKTEGVTVMVSRDPRLGFWAEVLEFQCPARRRLVAMDRIEAVTLLEARRAVGT